MCIRDSKYTMFIKGGREMNKKVIGAVLSVTMILAAGTTVRCV